MATQIVASLHLKSIGNLVLRHCHFRRDIIHRMDTGQQK
jgi:hypothetical protein